MIRVQHLVKSFINPKGIRQAVLKDLSFEIKQGETVAIIGPSGSGKSTLVRSLNLLEMPDSGILTLDDLSIECPTRNREQILKLRRKTGMVFQSFNLFPHLTALHNVMLGLVSVKGLKKSEAHAIAHHYLAEVGLASFGDQYPSQLSGGQQQRVAIARSLALKPSIILMDEPTSALDPELVHEVLQVIKLVADESITLVIVTHELNFARNVADRIMFLEAGKIVEFDQAEKLFNAPKEPRTAAFLRNFHQPA